MCLMLWVMLPPPRGRTDELFVACCYLMLRKPKIDREQQCGGSLAIGLEQRDLNNTIDQLPKAAARLHGALECAAR